MRCWAILAMCGLVVGAEITGAAVVSLTSTPQHGGGIPSTTLPREPGSPPPVPLPRIWPWPMVWQLGPSILPSPPPGTLSPNTVLLKLEVLPRVPTPQFDVSPLPPASRIARYWCQLSVFFATQPAWMDELSLRCYVLLNSQVGAGTFALLKSDVMLVNIAKGQHRCDFFVHPNALLRYGEVVAVAVLASQADRVVWVLSQPPSARHWWEDYQPIPGMVLHRNNTPFAALNTDDFEQVKKP